VSCILSFSYKKGYKKFEPKGNEATEEWRRLHTEDVYDLYCSPHMITVSRIMRWVEHVARMGERRGASRVLVGRLEGKRPLGKTRPR